MLLGYYIPPEDSEVLGDLLGFLCAIGCKMGGNGYCLASDSLFFCYIYPGEGINIDFWTSSRAKDLGFEFEGF